MLRRSKTGFLFAPLVIASILATVLLNGCANYFGMHANAKPINLNKPSTTNSSINNWPGLDSNWWLMFNDCQLNQLINTALNNSPDIKIAQDRVEMAQEIAKAQASSLWPSINAAGFVTRDKYSQQGLIPPPFNGRIFNEGDIGLNFQYDFDFWGVNRHKLAADINETRATQADAAAARLVLATAIASAYFQYQSDIAQLYIANELLQQHQTMLEIIQGRAAKGVDSAYPVNSSIADVATEQIAVANLQQAAEITRHQIAALIGESPDDFYLITQPLNRDNQLLNIPDVIPANLLARRPDIAALCLRIQEASLNVTAAKGQFYPNINLNASGGYQSVLGLNNLFHLENQNWFFGPAINLPIFDAGQLRANLGEKYASYDVIVDQYNKAVINAMRDAADQLSTLRAIALQQKAQTALTNATKKTNDLTIKSYAHGITDYLNVLQTQSAVLQQDAAQVQLQTSYLQAIVATIHVLGGGYQEDGNGTERTSSTHS